MSLRHLAAVGLCLLVLFVPTRAAGAPVTYRWPVDATPVREFDAPSSAFGPGHRGVDLPVEVDQPVLPMAPGTVTFAGMVVGVRWVTVRHADGIRTSYGPLSRIAVATGDVVDRSAPIGRASGDAHGADAVGSGGRLHVGARLDGVYLDPARLVRGIDVPTLVGGAGRRADDGTAEARPTLVEGTPPSANHLILLAGFTSSTGHLPLEPGDLGYGDGDWDQFSYTGVGEDGQPQAYDAQDTWQRVHESALRLQEQLRAFAADNPGQAVDLVGHSLGGVIAMYYLLVLHDPADSALPPVGRVATLASPLQGADAAGVMRAWQDDPIAHALLELALSNQPGMDDDAPVVTDLAPDSEVGRAIREAWDRYRADPYASPLASGTDVLTVGGLTDPVVPEHRSDLPGADHETVVGDHSATPRHVDTLDMLYAFLGSRDLPDRGLEGTLVNLLGPLTVGISAAEQLAGLLVEVIL